MERMQLVARRQPLDRRDVAAIGLNRKARARLDGHTIDEHGAGAALARVAAHLGPGQTTEVPNEMDQQQSGLDILLAQAAIHRG